MTAKLPLRPEKSATPLNDPRGLGLYVHFPWCLTKCPYCDFLSVAVVSDTPGQAPSVCEARERIPHQAYANAVIHELKTRVQALDGELPELRSVFFGGGTPSLWDPAEVGRVLECIGDIFTERSARRELEVTVECNPTSLSTGHARSLLNVGVNRLSIGVQALESERLRFLGRLHDERGGRQAIQDARAAGASRISADLIYGVYNQEVSAAVADVADLALAGVSHLSAYALTIEPATRFGALAAQGKLPLLDDSVVAHSFEAVSNTLQDLGFSHYEISNFARPGQESIHNMGYWCGRDYLGVGTGAFGTVTTSRTRLRYRNVLSPTRYLETWTPEASPFDPFTENLAEREMITPEISLDEALLLGLRTEAGINLEAIATLRGSDPLPPSRQEALRRLEDVGKIVRQGARLSIPRSHWLFADGIIRDLL